MELNKTVMEAAPLLDALLGKKVRLAMPTGEKYEGMLEPYRARGEAYPYALKGCAVGTFVPHGKVHIAGIEVL